MNQYYLMAQLPSLDALGETTPLPITEVRFHQLCRELADKKAQKALGQLTLTPEQGERIQGNGLLATWLRKEQQLRLALGTARAARMQKSFDAGESDLPADLMQTARTAVELRDPMEAEQYLQQHRLAVLEALRPADAFCQDSLLYYGLKLRLLARMRKFDADRGQAAYRNIYDSILHGDSQESEHDG